MFWIRAHLPDFLVGVLAHGIKVGADCSIKQSWLLRNDAQLWTQVTQTQCADVNIIDGNAAWRSFNQSKQSQHQTWFSCPFETLLQLNTNTYSLSSNCDHSAIKALPLPVLPTTPTFVPPFIVAVTPFNTSGMFGRYLNCKIPPQ